MKHILQYSLLITIVLLASRETQAQTFFTDADIFFKSSVAKGKVDYGAIKADSAKLDALVKTITSYNVDSQPAAAQKAFWLNTYNILVIKSVIEHYPLSSPMKVKGFFDKKRHLAAGQTLTLNDIENKKLRKPYKDARVHFVLVCGAKGCPPLTSSAYLPQKIEKQLEKQTRKALNSVTFIRVNESESTVLISEIFKWYKGDFTNNGQSLLGYINGFRINSIPLDFKVDFYTYNWRLNGQ